MGNPPAYEALRSLDQAIRDLAKPVATGTETSPLGAVSHSIYRAGEYGRGYNPDDPEVVAVREDLIGAAFAIAQTYAAKNAQPTQRLTKIRHVANYWKHRDEWGSEWKPTKSHERTIAGVLALGEKAPVRPGQLEKIAEAALGSRFDADALWDAITVTPT